MNGDIRENVIEFITNEHVMTMTLTQPRYISKVRRLVEEYKSLGDERADFLENPDGSVFAHLPLECLKLGKKRTIEMSAEDKASRCERLRVAREARGRRGGDYNE